MGEAMNSSDEWNEPWKKAIEGHASIRTLHEKLRSEIFRKWNRTLPFPDELFDRWEKARYLGFGEGTSIYDSAIVIGDVIIGRNVWIGPNVMLDGSGGLRIGDYCTLATGSMVYSHDTVEYCLTGGKASISQMGTSIGDCTYLGSLVVVDKNVSIGSHCVIGAHSFVCRDIPDNSIAVGCPARVIGNVELSADGRSARLVYE